MKTNDKELMEMSFKKQIIGQKERRSIDLAYVVEKWWLNSLIFSYTFCLWCYLAFRVLRRVQVDCPCITQLLVCRRVLNCFVNYIEIVNLYIGFQSIISTPPCSNLSFSTHSIIGTSPFHRVVFVTINKYFSEEINKIGVTKINSYFSVKTSSFSCRLDKDFLV